MIHRTLHSAVRRLTHFTSDRQRERVLCLATTALVLLAGAGTFGMNTHLAS